MYARICILGYLHECRENSKFISSLRHRTQDARAEGAEQAYINLAYREQYLNVTLANNYKPRAGLQQGPSYLLYSLYNIIPWSSCFSFHISDQNLVRLSSVFFSSTHHFVRSSLNISPACFPMTRLTLPLLALLSFFF